MKYLIIISIISIAVLFSCGDGRKSNLVEEGSVMSTDLTDTCDCKDLTIDSTGLHKKDDEPYTGICLGFYPETDLVYVEKNLLKGKLHGKVIYYDKAGEELIEEIYENGKSKRSGKSEIIVCNCNELVQMKASDPRMPARFSLDEIPFTGTCKSFYADSVQIYLESNYKNGFLDGYTTYYGRDGSKLYMEKYNNGILEKTVN